MTNMSVKKLDVNIIWENEKFYLTKKRNLEILADDKI